jgi:hypothetical protein
MPIKAITTTPTMSHIVRSCPYPEPVLPLIVPLQTERRLLQASLRAISLT